MTYLHGLHKNTYLFNGENVQLPQTNAEVELLIITDASKFHEPWKVVNIEGEEPMATKTLLRWVVGGTRRPSCSSSVGALTIPL